jgi:hypothetical protein
MEIGNSVLSSQPRNASRVFGSHHTAAIASVRDIMPTLIDFINHYKFNIPYLFSNPFRDKPYSTSFFNRVGPKSIYYETDACRRRPGRSNAFL